MAAERAPAASLHPWVADFLAAPAEKLRDLLFGRASLGPLGNAQIPDAALLLFGPLNPEGVERRALDAAVSSFLHDSRASSAQANRSTALACADALRLVSLLSLPASVDALRSDIDLWLSWAEALPTSSAVDTRAELFSTWALTQRLARTGSLELEPFWLAMCDEIGERYPRSYLQIAILGLRMLPERPGAPGERAWMSGLLRWAVARRPDADEFSFEWRALRTIYPRTSAYWRHAVAYTLKDSAAQNLSAEIEGRWRYDVGLNEETEADVVPDPLWSTMGPAQEAFAIIGRLDTKLAAIAPEIRQHISHREKYAEATGNHYFLTRSACNIGMKLIKRGPDEERSARGELATELAVIALHWDATSVYGWALWRDALAATGAYEAAELVGWEAVRRFPENEQWRNQLAMLISSLGREAESESLLAETIRRFPRDAVSRSQLALLWLAAGRDADAAAILEPGIREGFADGMLYSAFARATYGLRGKDAASFVLSQGLRQFPDDEPLIRYRDYLAQYERFPTLAPVLIREGHSGFAGLPEATARAGRLRRIEETVRLQISSPEWRELSVSQVQSELNSNPHSDYARYLLNQLHPDTPASGFVGALWKAMQQKDSELLSELEEKFKGRQHLFDVARSFLFADQEAAARLSKWLSSDVYQESRANTALRHFLSLRFGEAIDRSDYSFSREEPRWIIEVLAANDNVRWDLLEVAVASLTYPLAA